MTPAQVCAQRVRTYLAKHPLATWPELFSAVPNHYKTVASMLFSMNHYFGISCIQDKGKGKPTRYNTNDKPCGIAFVLKMLGPDYLNSEEGNPRRPEPRTLGEMMGMMKINGKWVQV